MHFKEFLNESTLTVYRGTGPRGMEEMRPSEEGTYGPGIYFYDNIEDARAYAERGGGIIQATVNTSDPEIKVVESPVHMVGTKILLRTSKVVVVPDASKVKVVRLLRDY